MPNVPSSMICGCNEIANLLEAFVAIASDMDADSDDLPDGIPIKSRTVLKCLWSATWACTPRR
ncbi:hypothetical protein MPLDJ20_220024 [Mesorhizobium plurifarium]|uniref:Uncharacterized protein n=1 Tax=Mesorhizobium plurifarium TaxID=69974 RepID=A0A090F928_MESPL|nr:hypothetical protein MPLDJ20_220024 [Mesorhizobium plurifarium]